MKTKSSLLFILIAAFFLTSCGAKKTSATFEVSTSAITMGNTSYPGGLVIMGSSKSGTFTIPIAANTGSGNKITLDLPRDSWTFSAIGWLGANKFSGDSYCGSQADVDLNEDDQTVNLQIGPSKCGTLTSVFGSSSFRAGDQYYPLKIATCGWLYEDDGSTLLSTSTAETFCNTASVHDAKYKNWAKSLKIEVLQKDLDGKITPGISQCIATGSDGLFTPTMNVPEKGVPFVITLYNQTGCPSDGTIISKFDFSDGLGGTYGDHDSVINKNATTIRLFLPSYDTKRGYSGLTSQKANPLECNTNQCMEIPTSVPNSKDRIIKSGSQFVVTANPGTNQTCDKLNGSFTVADINPAPLLSDLKSGCEMKNGKLLLRLNYTSLATSPTLTLTFTGGSNIPLTFYENSTYDAHELGWETLGHFVFPGAPANVRDSFKVFFEENQSSGLLSEVRDLMGPEGAGGILGPAVTCSTTSAEKMVSFYEEGELKIYKVQLMNASVTAPLISPYIADGTAPVGDPFDKKIAISRLVGGSYTQEMSLHFNCNYSVGRFQNRHIRNGKIEKTLLEWNTAIDGNERAKEIRYEEEQTNGFPTKVYTSFRYAESPSDSTTMYVRTFQNMITWNNTNYTFSPRSSQLSVKDGPAGFTYLDASGAAVTGTLNSTTYQASLTTAIGTPTANLCVDKYNFATVSPGVCSTLPTSFASDPTYETWDPNNLIPQNTVNFFTGF